MLQIHSIKTYQLNSFIWTRWFFVALKYFDNPQYMLSPDTIKILLHLAFIKFSSVCQYWTNEHEHLHLEVCPKTPLIIFKICHVNLLTYQWIVLIKLQHILIISGNILKQDINMRNPLYLWKLFTYRLLTVLINKTLKLSILICSIPVTLKY